MSDVHESSVFSSSDTDLEENETELNTGCYNHEPKYTKDELSQMNFSSDDESSSSGSDTSEASNTSRLENLHWCSCETCVIFETMLVYECKCCREYDLLKNKLENLKCITCHPEFDILCLNKVVLETAAVRHRRYKSNFKDISSFNNK